MPRGAAYPLWESYSEGNPFDGAESRPVQPDSLAGTLTLSRLIGGPRTFLELGAGVLGRLNRTGSADDFPSTVGLTGIAGVRLQPDCGGVGFRLAFTPLVDRRGFHALVGVGVSYGLR